MRLSIDSPNIYENELPADLNRWFTTLVSKLNYFIGNVIAYRTPDIIIQVPAWGTGAGPYSVPVPGLTSESIVVANIHSSTNAVSVQKVTATSAGFDILFSGDPGASCFVNYMIFVSPFEAIGA